MAEEKAVKATKIKKKRWIQILSPALFRNELIGEIPVNDPKLLIERTITINLMGLTRDIKKQSTNVKFVITSIKGDKAVTDFYGYYLNPSSVKRLVRRGKEKTDLSITCKTSDNKKIRIKPIIIPYSKVKGSVASAFRRNATSYLSSYAAKTTFENIIKDSMTNKLQRELKAALKKVHPVRILEIAKLHIETEKKPVEKKVKVEVKEEVKEKKQEEKKEEVKEEKPKEAKEKEEAPKKEEQKEETKKEEKKEEPKREVKEETQEAPKK